MTNDEVAEGIKQLKEYVANFTDLTLATKIIEELFERIKCIEGKINE
jgi:hypothetical protein